jgi:peptidoglycan/LPS O-acetylase OafA/YrhL
MVGPEPASTGTGNATSTPQGVRGPHVPPETPDAQRRRRRPRWPIAVVVLGLVLAAAAVYFDAFYVGRHLADPSRYDSFALLPTVVLIPASALALIIGGLGLVRRPWLRVAVVVLGLAWAVVACYAPAVISGPVQPVL